MFTKFGKLIKAPIGPYIGADREIYQKQDEGKFVHIVDLTADTQNNVNNDVSRFSTNYLLTDNNLVCVGYDNPDNPKPMTDETHSSLIWIHAKLGEQKLPMMIDSGATPNCLASRCVEASLFLRKLPRKKYEGNHIIDANGNHINPLFSIKGSLKLGTPTLSLDTEFLVVDSLPFSCIIGQNTLSKFSKWSVCNANNTIEFNNSRIQFYSHPNHTNCDSVKLITSPGADLDKNLSGFRKTHPEVGGGGGEGRSPPQFITNDTISMHLIFGKMHFYIKLKRKYSVVCCRSLKS